MTQEHKLDEYLEQLWYMKEAGQTSVHTLKRALSEKFDSNSLDNLATQGLVTLSGEGKDITLTDTGMERARQLVRAHRLAERLLHDVMGGDFETGACEFEHTVSLDLVNSICTLLGHPKECPHGLPIPQGDCCQRSEKISLTCVVPLNQIKLGQSARIAYVKCQNDEHIHQLEGLCVRPGVVIKLLQSYPTYVIECEGAQIALDNDIAGNISVWKDR
jgi:DtxR family transcriptional regulator, Mn-dependent transcriptional regulator